MTIIIDILIGLGLFFLLTKINKEKYSFSLICFLLTGLCVVGYVINTFYNWGYYKQYDGPETSEFLIAKYLELILRNSILIFLITGLLLLLVGTNKDNIKKV